MPCEGGGSIKEPEQLLDEPVAASILYGDDLNLWAWRETISIEDKVSLVVRRRRSFVSREC